MKPLWCFKPDLSAGVKCEQLTCSKPTTRPEEIMWSNKNSRFSKRKTWNVAAFPVPTVISCCRGSLTTTAVMVTSMAVLTTSVACHTAQRRLGTICLDVTHLSHTHTLTYMPGQTHEPTFVLAAHWNIPRDKMYTQKWTQNTYLTIKMLKYNRIYSLCGSGFKSALYQKWNR